VPVNVVVLDCAVAAEWERAITERVGAAARVLSVTGTETDLDLSGTEIAISGWDGHDGATYARMVEEMTELRWVHSISAGLDGLASPSLARRELILTSSGEAYAPAMAEHAIGMMIAVQRGFPQLVRSQGAGQWEWDRAVLESRALGRLLHGKTVGIVGLGRVGRRVAAACRGLGMEVWALRRTPGGRDDDVARMLGPEQLDELLANSDFVVLSASLNSTTAALIGAAELTAMKRSAVLVNVGRGGLIDQDALVDALRSGEIAAAALDVTTPEPLPPGDDLWSVENVLISPHMAGDSKESTERAIAIFVDNLERYLAGELTEMPDRVDLSAHL
jgi:phosphoglycerate dehydrogenase-like enzyme